MKLWKGPVCDEHNIPRAFRSWSEKREHDKRFHRAKFMARLQREKEIKRQAAGAREDSDIWEEYYGSVKR